MTEALLNQLYGTLAEELGQEEALNLCREVFRKKVTAAVYNELHKGPSTAPDLSESLGTQTIYIYRALKFLQDHGLIENVGKVEEKRPEHGGKAPILYKIVLKSQN